MFLLDTMVVSESRKKRADRGVMAWLDAINPEQLFVSSISFGEIAAGIEKKRSLDPVFVRALSEWLATTRAEFKARTLNIDVDVALRWGELYMRLKRRDMDLLIAATALEHDLTIATRNVRHFEPTGAKLFNPYEA